MLIIPSTTITIGETKPIFCKICKERTIGVLAYDDFEEKSAFVCPTCGSSLRYIYNYKAMIPEDTIND